MAAKASAMADSHTEVDIRQLQGLAEQQDDEAFLPLVQDELGPQFPRRVLGFKRLVEDVIARANETEWASTSGRRMVATATSYGVWLNFSRASAVHEKADALFGIDYSRWPRYRDTPLWLIFSGDSTPPDLRRALEPLRHRDPPELLGEAGQQLKIPIELPVGKEYKAICDAVFARLEEIAQLIAR